MHKWKSLVNHPIFALVMVIYHYVERIGEFWLPPIFLYNIYNHEKYYPGELCIIHIQSLINIIQENNWVITTKKW